MYIEHDILDALGGIGVGWHLVPFDPGAPSIYNVTIRMAKTTPYLQHQVNEFNGGAGLDPEDAKWAAIGESVERYCSGVLLPERFVFGSWKELQSQNPLHPDEIALFADFQEKDLPTQLFKEDTPVTWVHGKSLITGKNRLVPACLVQIPYMRMHKEEIVIGPAISTGMACGPDLDWILRSGLNEYIERDAFSIFWLNKRPAPQLILDEPWIEKIVKERFQRPNLEYLLFLMETDLPHSTVICFIKDYNFDPPIVNVGGACRADIRKAIVKAMVEAVQGWTWARFKRLEQGAQETPTSFQHITGFEERVDLYATADMDASLSFLFDNPERIKLSDIPVCSTSETEAIPKMLSAIHEAGSDVVYVDLTMPDIQDLGLQVGKVYCPALQQIEGNFQHILLGGKRWSQVPQKLGWRTTPTLPEEINPFPHPYP